MLFDIHQVSNHSLLSLSSFVLLLIKPFSFLHHGFFFGKHVSSTPIRNRATVIETASVFKTIGRLFVYFNSPNYRLKFIGFSFFQILIKSLVGATSFITIEPTHIAPINLIVPKIPKQLNIVSSFLRQSFFVVRSVFKSFFDSCSRIVKRFKPWVGNSRIFSIFLFKFFKSFCFSPDFLGILPINKVIFCRKNCIQTTSINRSRANG